MTATDVTQPAAHWLADAPKAQSDVSLQPLRERGRDQFVKLAWPSSKHEAWQNTSLAAVQKQTWLLARGAEGQAARIDAFLAANPWKGSRLVFVNGHLSRSLIRDEDAAGLRIMPISEAEAQKAPLAPSLGELSHDTTHLFAALNSAHLRDGVAVTVQTEQAISAPLQLLFLTQREGQAWMAHPRVLVVAQERAQAAVFEHHASLDDGNDGDVADASQSHLINGVTECHVASMATLDYAILQDGTKSALYINQWMAKVQTQGTARCAVVNLGGALARQEMHVQLAGPEAACNLTGLNLARRRQHMDNQITVDHQSTHGTSTQLFKNVLDDHATSVFSGRVLVQPGAVKTSAQQMNRNILLSRHAVAYTRPQLEILADDVRCTHGATVGQLQGQAMFYLRSRGLDEATSRRLLTYAQACEALQDIRNPAIHALCDARVRSELALEAEASTLGEIP